MKKVLALMAVVAMIAISSVAYADTFNIGGSVQSTVAITACPDITLSPLTPTTKVSTTCTNDIESNDTDGYQVTFSDSDATVTLDSASTLDSIATLPTGGTTCATGTDCYSWYISTLNDGTAGTDTDNGSAAFDAGEHSMEALLDVETILSSTNQYDGDFTMTFYGTVDATTEEASDYTNTGEVLISAL